METATIRIPEEKKNLLKAISCLENKKMNDIIVDLIDEYVNRHKETLELLAVPGLYERIMKASREFKEKKTITLKDARKKLET
jgi:PHD/YefM family antitoxin component YafN of YafNO toxin-antitoxin module